MAEKESSYDILIHKLDQFIRKYYINQIIRGALYTVGFVLLLFLFYSILEYYFYFAKPVRKFFFFSFIIATLASIGYWVIKPLLSYLHLGKTISHEQAANIIGTHFTNVEDKLLNVLQLKKQTSQAHSDLIEASIDQKSNEIRLVPFKNAIDLRGNRKYLRYALPPFMIFLFLLFAAPSIFTDSTYRIINNQQEFAPDAPFQLTLLGEQEEIVQYSDYVAEVKIDGNTVPSEVFIEINGYPYRMTKVNPDLFTYTIKNIVKDTPFKIYSGPVQSKEYLLKVIEKPILEQFSMNLNYPNYTGNQDQRIENTGDATVPEGTWIQWELNTNHTDNAEITFGREPHKITNENGKYISSKQMLSDEQYRIYLHNEKIPTPDSFLYQIRVIKDQRPSINLEKIQDSTDQSLVFLTGDASDDYGIKKLDFTYTITSEDNTSTTKTESLPVKGKTASNYDYVFDLQKLDLQPGDNVSYYIEVWDNDQINGSKSTKSQISIYKKATLEEMKEESKMTREEIEKQLEEALKETKEVKEEFKELKDKLRQKKDLDWQAKKELEKLLQKQQDIQQKMENAKENFKKSQKQEENMEKSPEMEKKEEQMEEMFEQLQNEEMNELMEKIRELMEELQKDEALEMMEQMEYQDQSLEQELDRLKELYKELELEKKVEELTEELDKLAEEEEKLAEETENQEKPQEQLEKEQQEIEEKFEELQKELEDIEKKNEELQKPKDLGGDNQEKMEDIEKDMDDAQKQMNEENNKGASKSQKNAAEKMKKMAQDMKQGMQQSQENQTAEDMKVIRQLLENLLTLSFEQEDLETEFSHTDTYVPRYVELVQKQFRIQNDFSVVEDSLQALAKRQASIESYVIEKMTEVQQNLDKGIERLEERQKVYASENQRRVMKGLNDLALMLDESLNQMQQQMSSMMSGSQMCNNPKGQGQGKPGKVPTDKITEGQEGLNKDMKKMMEEMKQGKGKQGSDGEMSKEFAKAAAKQAALRKALEELQKENAEQGKGSGEYQQIIEQMDQIETDLVNKRLDAEMIRRQQEILTRLLKAEKADQQRELDNKRQAERAVVKTREFPPELQEYIKQREAQIEEYKTVSPVLKPYYKYLVEQYYQSLQTSQ